MKAQYFQKEAAGHEHFCVFDLIQIVNTELLIKEE
jgi:hypothetical protein